MASRTNQHGLCLRLQTVWVLAACTTVLASGGCHWRELVPRQLLPAEPCVFGKEPTKDEIVAYINQRSSKLASWQCSDASITSNSLPFRLSAHIAVARSKNFRLVASSQMGNEADFGSNAERVWVWMRRDPSKKIITVRHDQLDVIEGRMKIPFRPDWLMEALGVVPLDGRNVRMLPRQPGDKMARLLSREYTPGGQIVQRVIVVDCCNGNIVSHTLEDTAGRVMMTAEFNSYQTERHSGLKMPYRIDLKWPQADMAMTLRLGTIEVNPREFAPKTWQMPQYDGCTALDLGRGLATTPHSRRNLQAKHQELDPRRVRIQPLRHERPEFEDDQRLIHPTGEMPKGPRDAAPKGVESTPAKAPGPFARPFPGTRTSERPQFADE